MHSGGLVTVGVIGVKEAVGESVNVGVAGNRVFVGRKVSVGRRVLVAVGVFTRTIAVAVLVSRPGMGKFKSSQLNRPSFAAQNPPAHTAASIHTTISAPNANPQSSQRGRFGRSGVYLRGGIGGGGLTAGPVFAQGVFSEPNSD